MVTYRKLASSSIAATERALRRRLDRLSDQNGSPGTPRPEMDELMEGGDHQDDLDAPASTAQFFVDEEVILRELLAAAARVRVDGAARPALRRYPHHRCRKHGPGLPAQDH